MMLGFGKIRQVSGSERRFPLAGAAGKLNK